MRWWQKRLVSHTHPSSVLVPTQFIVHSQPPPHPCHSEVLNSPQRPPSYAKLCTHPAPHRLSN